MTRLRAPVAVAGLLVLIGLLALVSLSAGKVWVPFDAWLDRADPRWPIIFDLRLPRTLLGIVVGAALGMSGAAMQGYTRNPLADPGALGVSSMAACHFIIRCSARTTARKNRTPIALRTKMPANISSVSSEIFA